MTTFTNTLFLALFAFIAFAVLYPNPYGNNPDIIGDESYFLTSSLSAIEQHTLPGWEFSESGSYYGGPQAYIDTAVLIPAIGAVLIFSHGSVSAAKIWVAQNTGELLHILRLVNGIVALSALFFCFLFFRKRKIPRSLALSLTLFLALLLSNVLVIEFLHTAKMWALYTVIVAVSSAFFIAQEYYLSELDRPFLKKETYSALLIWSAVLAFFQSLVGVFSILLLIFYAFLLRHIAVFDVWEYVRKRWYLIALFSVTQISFLYRGFKMFMAGTFADASTKTATGAIDWFARLTKPLAFTVDSQPLSLLYIVAAVGLLFLAFSKERFFAKRRRRMYVAIALAHPLLVYLFFHVIVGFDVLPRYAILLTLACSFSAAILLGEIGTFAVLGALAASGALFIAVNAHAIQLYWHPSSETVLLQTIEEKYNVPANVFIVDHSARRMTLPVNADSLLLLNQKRQDMGRFTFLLENRQYIPPSTFKPLTLIAYAAPEEAADLALFKDGRHSVWIIRRLCTDRCTPRDIQAGTCFEIHIDACGLAPQEINTLPVFLGATQLGYSYIAHKIY